MSLILDNKELQRAITSTAKTEKEIGLLQGRAVDIVSRAQGLESTADLKLTDDALVSIATSAVGTLDIEEAALAGYQNLVGWLGPVEVPDKVHVDMVKAWSKLLVAAFTHKPGTAIPEVTALEKRDLSAQDVGCLVDQAVMDAKGIHKAVGRIEGLEFTRRVGEIAIAQIFTDMRKSKKYKGLPYKDENGITRHIGTFEEFCSVELGKSYNRCLELSQNLHTLGPDLYESAERIGFRAKDYRALNALPASEQEVVKAAMESESKDEVLDILQDMAARHQAEKEAAKKERDDLQADMDARDKVLESKAEQLDKAQMELAKLKSLPKDADTELRLEVEAEAVKRLNELHITTLAEMNQFLAHIFAMTITPNISAHTNSYAMQIAEALCQDIGTALVEQGIPVDFENIVTPEWTRTAAQADHDTGNVSDGFGAR